jgi:serine/threonine protein kinase
VSACSFRKPENVLLQKTKLNGVQTLQIKLCDFGFAVHGDGSRIRSKVKGIAVGTDLYLSPEQLQDEFLEIWSKSDVYSLGIIMIELLTGITPWKEENYAFFEENVGRKHLKPNFTIEDIDLANLVNQCLEADQNIRPSFGTIWRLLLAQYEVLNIDPAKLSF